MNTKQIKRILWFTWKDLGHPASGGAEIVNEQLAQRLVADGYELIFVVGGFPGCQTPLKRNGYTIIRTGGRWTVYWYAYRYYKQHLVGWADLVIDEINTMPFFAKFYAKAPNLLFVHQLCRQIWFYQIGFPFNLIGYLLEPLYLYLLRDRTVITVSESTKRDLVRYGYDPSAIHTISEGIELEPVDNLKAIKKYDQPTMLSLGSIREMKRTHCQITAFEQAKAQIPNLQLKIAGDNTGAYGHNVMTMIDQSPYRADIEYLGRVSKEKKIEVMQRSHLIAVTSVKEGWGLIVTEANSQGTPAVVYDVDGLRDSVQDGKTGLITTSNTAQALGQSIVTLLQDEATYQRLRQAGWQLSRTITFERSYQDFQRLISDFLAHN
jgi:glycosyltransferase involved in cell wall biosynthesis